MSTPGGRRLPAAGASVSLPPQDREIITKRLHAALWALEHDDHAGWRSNVDELIQWPRDLALYQSHRHRQRRQQQSPGQAQAGAQAELGEQAEER